MKAKDACRFQGRLGWLDYSNLSKGTRKFIDGLDEWDINCGAPIHVGTRIRVMCPVCKRRMYASTRVMHDGDGLYIYMPPHKRRKWWKRGKRSR
jgi:hypothetical protein